MAKIVHRYVFFFLGNQMVGANYQVIFKSFSISSYI